MSCLTSEKMSGYSPKPEDKEDIANENDTGKQNKEGIAKMPPNFEPDIMGKNPRTHQNQKVTSCPNTPMKTLKLKVTLENLTRKIIEESAPNVEHNNNGENFKSLPKFKADKMLAHVIDDFVNVEDIEKYDKEGFIQNPQSWT